MEQDRMTKGTLAALNRAQMLAMDYGNAAVEPEHMLLGLLDQQGGLAREILIKAGTEPSVFTSELEGIVNRKPKVTGQRERYLSPEGQRVLYTAEKQASRLQDDYISVEHLLLAMISTSSGELKNLFVRHGITEDRVMQVLKSIRGNQRVTSDEPEQTYNVLEKYGSDLVKLSRSNKLDPVIGRDDEIRRTIRILSRKTKNNPVLIGEPGVGKTAIAEGLAHRIVKGDVPESPKDKTI